MRSAAVYLPERGGIWSSKLSNLRALIKPPKISLRSVFFFPAVLVLTASLMLLPSCGGSGGGGGGGDTTSPLAANWNPTSSPIKGDTTITIYFNESMSNSSQVLTGNMGLESDNGTWTTTINTNDTLVINPSSTWTEGLGQTLIVDAADVAGNPLLTLTINFDIDTTPPWGTESPIDGSVLSGSTQVVIDFSESMNTTSVVLGGTLTSDSYNIDWY